MSKLMSATGARRLLWATAGLLLFALIAALARGVGTQMTPNGPAFLGQAVTSEQLGLGQVLYAQNCASCHGADLEGQPNWRRRLDTGRMPAPPHDESGHTWHHSDQDLFKLTKLGVGAVIPGHESDMPAFEGILSDGQIMAVLAYIKSRWSEQIQVKQAEITKQHGDR